VWGLCDGVPVCVATDKIRPCTPEKALSYLYLNKPGLEQYIPAKSNEQPKYIRILEETRRKTPRELNIAEVQALAQELPISFGSQEDEMIREAESKLPADGDAELMVETVPDVQYDFEPREDEDVLKPEDEEMEEPEIVLPTQASSSIDPQGSSLSRRMRRAGIRGKGVGIIRKVEEREDSYKRKTLSAESKDRRSKRQALDKDDSSDPEAEMSDGQER